jgi:hypothetical protein
MQRGDRARVGGDAAQLIPDSPLFSAHFIFARGVRLIDEKPRELTMFN